MTLDYERFMALRGCREYLEKILKGELKFPRTIKETKEKAYRLLKHFPEQHFIDKLEKLNEQANKSSSKEK